MDINYKNLGQRVRLKRSKCRMTQEKLAELSGLSIPHVSHIETGKTKVSLESLVRIANVLHTTVDELLFDSIVESRSISQNEIADILGDCSPQEVLDLGIFLRYMKEFLRRKSQQKTV